MDMPIVSSRSFKKFQMIFCSRAMAFKFKTHTSELDSAPADRSSSH